MNHKDKLTARDILKKTGISILNPDNSVAEAAAKFKSSHDSVSVIDNNKLMGIVSPYYTLIKRTYPSQTKLKSCLYSPPKIKLDTPLKKVASMMLETKIHYLPVLDEKGGLLGLVTARRLLRKIVDEEGYKNIRAGEFIEKKKYLQTINSSSSFSEAIRFFYNTKLSKLIVVDNNNKLSGIITFFDLLPLLQFSKKRKGFWDRGGDDYSKYENYRLSSYIKKLTTQVNLNTSLSKVMELILDKEIGSVVIMRDKFRPENLITTSDLLKSFVLRTK